MQRGHAISACSTTVKLCGLNTGSHNETYIMKEESSHPAKQRSVDGGSRATYESPFFFPVMRYGRIGMMEVRW